MPILYDEYGIESVVRGEGVLYGGVEPATTRPSPSRRRRRPTRSDPARLLPVERRRHAPLPHHDEPAARLAVGPRLPGRTPKSSLGVVRDTMDDRGTGHSASARSRSARRRVHSRTVRSRSGAIAHASTGPAAAASGRIDHAWTNGRAGRRAGSRSSSAPAWHAGCYQLSSRSCDARGPAAVVVRAQRRVVGALLLAALSSPAAAATTDRPASRRRGRRPSGTPGRRSTARRRPASGRSGSRASGSRACRRRSRGDRRPPQRRRARRRHAHLPRVYQPGSATTPLTPRRGASSPPMSRRSCATRRRSAT
jgi:hypothetical protein